MASRINYNMGNLRSIAKGQNFVNSARMTGR